MGNTPDGSSKPNGGALRRNGAHQPDASPVRNMRVTFWGVQGSCPTFPRPHAVLDYTRRVAIHTLSRAWADIAARLKAGDGKDKYFAVIDALYLNQEEAFQAPRETLMNIARSVGMNDAQFNACVSDEKALQALNDRVEKHNKEGIDSTPTFVINGKKMEPGYHSLEEIDAAIKAAGG